MTSNHTFVATCTVGVEHVLADELRALPKVQNVATLRGAVRFHGPLIAGYRACMWTRTSSRILIELGEFRGDDSDAIYDGVQQVDWTEHIASDGTMAVDFVGTSDGIRNSMFGAVRVKDAICDYTRDRKDERPSVDLERPDVRIHVHLRQGRFGVSLDLAGDPMHRRGYHRAAGPAPIKESLAAAILHLADWPEAARAGSPLVDPMCGSGTFLLEAAGIAFDRAPGLGRSRWGFLRWLSHQPEVWTEVVAEAQERKAAAAGRSVAIYGADIDPEAVRTAKVNAQVAELPIQVRRQAVADSSPPDSSREHPPFGLLVTNPPYGERLSSKAGAKQVGRELGRTLTQRYWGWRAVVIAGSRELADGIGLPPMRSKPLWNGPIECRLLQYDIGDTPPRGPGYR